MKIEKKDNKTNIIKPDSDVDTHKGSTSVLLSDVIEYYIRYYFLVVPCYPDNIRAASYDFTIGDEFKYHKERHYLTVVKPELVVKPHDAVVVRTKEHLNMPRFLIGRWNLRVTKVYAGLVWVGGIHVDPGWEGELWCPLYNLSNDNAKVPKDDTFASVDFVKTTSFNENCKKYVSNRGEPDHPGSSLEKMSTDLKITKSELEEYKNTHYTLIGIIIAAISILTAFTVPDNFSDSLINTNQTSSGHLSSVLNLDVLSAGILSVITSTGAIIVSVVALLLTIKTRKRNKDLGN
jgi:deoxycytidine triphosphate deaminase